MILETSSDVICVAMLFEHLRMYALTPPLRDSPNPSLYFPPYLLKLRPHAMHVS